MILCHGVSAPVHQGNLIHHLGYADRHKFAEYFDSIRAIETQMVLLQAVRGSSIDAYYAFRLGVLGKLVARRHDPPWEGEQAPEYYLTRSEMAVGTLDGDKDVNVLFHDGGGWSAVTGARLRADPE